MLWGLKLIKWILRLHIFCDAVLKLNVRMNGHQNIFFFNKSCIFYYRITEFCSSQESLDIFSSNPLLKQGHTGKHPRRFWMSQRRLHNTSGQPVPVLYHRHSKEVLPHVHLKLPVFQFVSTAHFPVTGQLKESGPSTWLPPIRYL